MFFTNGMKRIEILAGQCVTPEGRDRFWTFRPYEYVFALANSDHTRGRVLDCGCGVGYPLKIHLAKVSPFPVTALDNDPGILQEPDVLNLTQINSDMSGMPFGDNFFSSVICVSVLEHVSQVILEAFVNECSRIVKPGGKVIITVDWPRVKIDVLSQVFRSNNFDSEYKYDPAIPADAVKFFHPGFETHLYCWGDVYVNRKEA